MNDARSHDSTCAACTAQQLSQRAFVRYYDVWVLPHIAQECHARKVSIRRIAPDSDGANTFTAVLDLAARAYCTSAALLAAPSDRYSRIYVAFRDNRLVGTITVTYARDGQLSTDEFLPAELVTSLRPVVCSAYRLAVEPSAETSGMAKLLMRISFADGVAEGMRLAVVTARTEMSTYYRRLGYLELKDTEFKHPRLGTQHIAFCCPADPLHRSSFSDICHSVLDPVRRAFLENYLSQP